VTLIGHFLIRRPDRRVVVQTVSEAPPVRAELSKMNSCNVVETAQRGVAHVRPRTWGGDHSLSPSNVNDASSIRGSR
jgi:hypothetical protein